MMQNGKTPDLMQRPGVFRVLQHVLMDFVGMGGREYLKR